MDTSQPQKPVKPFKLLMIFAALLIFIGTGVVWFVFFSPPSPEASFDWEGIKSIFLGPQKLEDGKGHLYKMDSFVVNLADPGQLRYLKITIYMESTQEKINEEYEKRLPQLRDAILTLLSGKNYREIMSSEGKKILREEIKKEMNQILTEFKVRNVYFTEFVIQ